RGTKRLPHLENAAQDEERAAQKERQRPGKERSREGQASQEEDQHSAHATLTQLPEAFGNLLTRRCRAGHCHLSHLPFLDSTTCPFRQRSRPKTCASQVIRRSIHTLSDKSSWPNH